MYQDGYEDKTLVSKFEDFFQTKYKQYIENIAHHYPEKRRAEISFSDLEKYDYSLVEELLTNPDVALNAAKDAIANMDLPKINKENIELHVGVHELPIDKLVFLKDIGSYWLGKMFYVDGVVRQVTDVLPKLKKASWTCMHCGRLYTILQDDQRKTTQPYVCECGKRNFKLNEDASSFIDYQKIKVQEPLELTRSAEQAKYLDVMVEDDLVNRVSPGDRLKITGILRLRPPKNQGVVYERYLDATHIEEVQKDFEELEITSEEEEEIKKLAKDPKIYEYLVESIAPSIFGYEVIKEAISLQLFGGTKKILPDNSVKRGDIHMLLIGDPGTGKSMILQYVKKISPKSIYIAGKMVSGAGLAVTAEKDDFGDGGWTLKAGALVLASGGLAALDELDKMAEDDRSALHEAMEQQTISVAKAGLVGTFKAETAILAAANPKFGRFDTSELLIPQINLPPTLLSRFDLYYSIKDVLDKEKDLGTAKHILKTQKIGSMRAQLDKGISTNLKEEDVRKKEAEIKPKIEPELFRKYVAYAKRNIFPLLTKEAEAEIEQFYLDLRDLGRREKTVPTTARQLDAIVRLAEASARVRLNKEVTLDDAKRAIRLLKTAMQDVGMDPETGKIDIDIIATGQPASKVEKMKTVLGAIRELSSEFDVVPMNKVVEKAKEYNIDADRTYDIIEKLKRSGELYSPKHGYVRIP